MSISKSNAPVDITTISGTVEPTVFPDATTPFIDALNNRKDWKAWLKKYNLIVTNSVQDGPDQDGLSVALEFMYHTDPTKADTDGDGLSDGDEILIYGTNPLNPLDPNGGSDPTPRIVSIKNGRYTSDPRPFIRGVGPRNSKVEIAAVDSNRKEIFRVKTTTDEHGVFLLIPPQPLKNGRYRFVVRSFKILKKFQRPPAPLEQLSRKLSVIFLTAHAIENDESIELDQTSEPLVININSNLNIEGPKLNKLADEPISDEVLLNGLNLEIKDNKPVLTGKAGFNHQVVATWSSIVLTSALIADSTAGDFSIQPRAALPFGHHEVYVQSMRPYDKATSKTMKISFDITPAEDTTESVQVKSVSVTPAVQDTTNQSQQIVLQQPNQIQEVAPQPAPQVALKPAANAPVPAPAPAHTPEPFNLKQFVQKNLLLVGGVVVVFFLIFTVIIDQIFRKKKPAASATTASPQPLRPLSGPVPTPAPSPPPAPTTPPQDNLPKL